MRIKKLISNANPYNKPPLQVAHRTQFRTFLLPVKQYTCSALLRQVVHLEGSG